MKFYKIFLLAGLILFVGAGPAQAEPAAGESAPDFTLEDTEGRTRSLSDYRGKFVTLEWLNHDCPFVRKHYDSGNMQALQAKYTAKDVVWLSINSSAHNKQGHFHDEDANRLTFSKGASPTAVLKDFEGDVGKLYGAKTTPHMFIINPEGVLIYKGAIDDKPSTDIGDIKGAKNYVQAALDEALAGQSVTTTSTRSYGCSVKY